MLVVLATQFVYADTPMKKLGRGFCNILTCPLELFKGVQDVGNENGPLAAYSYGILEGLFNTVVRAAVGVYEVVTFPIPVPPDFEPILTNPEFFGEEDF